MADGLPYAVTCAHFLAPGVDLALTDGGPTRPGDLLDHLTGIAVYARDRWDTPVGEIRLLDDAELDALAAHCPTAADRLRGRIATMSRRDRVMAGGQVHYLDLLAPFARPPGCGTGCATSPDVYEWDPLASEAYYPLFTGGVDAEMAPRLIRTGAGFRRCRTDQR